MKRITTVSDLTQIRHLAQWLLREHPEMSASKAVKIASDYPIYRYPKHKRGKITSQVI